MPAALTVERIMRDPNWIGTSPSNPQWSADGKFLFFNWNPDQNISDSLYYITNENKSPVKASVQQKLTSVLANSIEYNRLKTGYVYAKFGDVFFTDIKTGKTKRITETVEPENNPRFSFNDSKVVFNRGQNLYAWNIATGETQQLTNIKGIASAATAAGNSTSGGNNSSLSAVTKDNLSEQEDWLKKDQLRYFEILALRKEKREKENNYTKETKPKELRSINIGDEALQGLNISPDGRFINYRLFKPSANAKNTIVPDYVTESGFTTDIPARTKVGIVSGNSEYFFYDRIKDTVIKIKTDSLPGIYDLPDYVNDYPLQLETRKNKAIARSVTIPGFYWSPGGEHAVLEIRSDDHKDRWLMLWDTATYQLTLLDRQRDEAWIGGPGIYGSVGWINEQEFWFQSEESGYSHLYVFNVKQGKKKPLTNGNYEIQKAQLSNDKKFFYITTNEVHPGEQHFYTLEIGSGKKERLTNHTGSHQVTISPDEKQLAILYSSVTQPWELYLQENLNGGRKIKNTVAAQITFKAKSDEFKSYPWQEPAVITITARDGAPIYARLYKPENPLPNRPAVLFIHGAGYLQNAHKWWSQYFREYMFNNLLAQQGYYVLDMDYRGSAGYGRNWRTGIYRHMGGKDLSDHIDAANFLEKNFSVDPKRIGLYGGSYGGFITLMGLFTAPDVFAAGAALRPVTDWANYNHPYTSNILNEPYTDSISYRRSSPVYFAEGLKGDLLICHGMVDVNVHYQDAVKLVQRLIELGKDNWELASYPMEDHGFIEPSSWTDEYKRIFKLFERVLKK